MAKKDYTAKVNMEAGSKMAPGLSTAGREISAFTRTAGGKLKGLGAISGGIGFGGVTGGVVAAGAVITAFVASSVNDFIKMEQKWAEVTTLLPQQTKRATDAMLGDVRKFSVQMGAEIQDAIGASYQAISAGVEASDLTQFLETAQRAAVGGVTDLTVATDGLTTVLNAYNLDADQAVAVSDSMFGAVRLGKTTFEELAASMGKVAPLASSLNIEFPQLAAGTAVLTASGLTTAEAITGLRGTFADLSKSGSKVSVMFKEITGQSFPEFTRGGGDVRDAMVLLAEEADVRGIEMADVFGRIEAANAALVVAADGNAELWDEAMGDMSGGTEAAFEKMEETTARKLAKIEARVQEAKGAIGGFLIDIIDSVISTDQAIQEFISNQNNMEVNAAGMVVGSRSNTAMTRARRVAAERMAAFHSDRGSAMERAFEREQIAAQAEENAMIAFLSPMGGGGGRYGSQKTGFTGGTPTQFTVAPSEKGDISDLGEVIDAMYRRGELGQEEYVRILNARLSSAGGAYTGEGSRIAAQIADILEPAKTGSSGGSGGNVTTDAADAAVEATGGDDGTSNYRRVLDLMYQYGELNAEGYRDLLTDEIAKAGGKYTPEGSRLLARRTQVENDIQKAKDDARAERERARAEDAATAAATQSEQDRETRLKHGLGAISDQDYLEYLSGRAGGLQEEFGEFSQEAQPFLEAAQSIRNRISRDEAARARDAEREAKLAEKLSGDRTTVVKIGDETVAEMVESRFGDLKDEAMMDERITVGSVHGRPTGACR